MIARELRSSRSGARRHCRAAEGRGNGGAPGRAGDADRPPHEPGGDRGAVPVMREETRQVLGITSYVDVLRALQGMLEED